MLSQRTPDACPACNVKVALIPLGKDESYKLQISPRTGLEVTFSRMTRAAVA